jgi:glucosamine--fructose-6-phosphate aminotransferase (isomerizing)
VTLETLMFREAAAAPAIVGQQIESPEIAQAADRLRSLNPSLVLTCARGSSDHAATYLQYLLPTFLDIPCYSHPPSLGSLLHGTSRRLDGAAMVLVSQSGRSPDLLRSAEAARAAGMSLVGCINDDQSPLAQMVDILLPVGAGVERSVAATKSFIATLATFAALAVQWKRDEELGAAVRGLASMLDQAWDADWSDAVEPIACADHLFVLGRDLTLGVAGEAALKLKETAALHAEAFSLAEVAHGPMALVGPHFPVLAFPSDAAVRGGALELLARFAARGAPTIVAGHQVQGALSLPVADAHPAIRPILIIQSFYRLCETIARARGRDPDNPPTLSKVTETL